MLVSAWLHQQAAKVVEFDEIHAALEAVVIATLTTDQCYDMARRLRAVLVDQESAVERGDPVQATACDEDFHSLLVSQSSNETLRSLVEGLISSTHTPALAVYSLPERARESLAQHRAIVEALASGDALRAAELAKTHMSDAIRQVAATPVSGLGSASR